MWRPTYESRWVPCEACDAGYIEHVHPLYGLASCPEPSVQILCPHCHGNCWVEIVLEPITLDDLEEAHPWPET